MINLAQIQRLITGIFKMTLNSRILPILGQFLLAVLAFMILQSLYPQLHPLPKTVFKITKSEAVEKAVNLLDHEIAPEKLETKVSFIVDQKYFREENKLSEIYEKLHIQPFRYWEIGLISSDKKGKTLTLQNDEVKASEDLTGDWYKILISPEGKILNIDFEKARQQNATGKDTIASLSGIPVEQMFLNSKLKALVFLEKIGEDTSGLSLNTGEVKRDSLGRTFSFIFSHTREGFKIRHDIKIRSNGEILTYQYSIPSLESGTAGESEKTADIIVGIISVIIFIVLLLFHVIYLIQFSRRELISFKIALPAVYFVAGITLLHTIFSMWYSAVLFNAIATVFLTLLYAGGILLLYAVGDAAARQEWDDKLVVADQFRQGVFFSALTGRTILRGFSLGIFALSTYSILLFIYMKYMNGVMASDTALKYSSYVIFPVLVFAMGSLNTAIFSELFFRLSGITFLKRWLKTTPGILIAGSLFAFLFTYPELKPGNGVAKFLLYLIPTLLFIFYFIRFEVITTLTGIFVFLMLERALVFVNTGEPYFREMGVSLFFVLILILMYGLVALLVKSRGEKEVPRFIPDYIRKQEERERLMRELEIARTVQLQFLPAETPQIENFQIAAFCRPAWEVGGDYFDFFRIASDKLGVAIGDVSNKGVSAAFYMTMVKGFLKALASNLTRPAEILSEANSLFYENVERGHFISMVFGILDTGTGDFTFARAGHNPVLLLFGSSAQGQWLIPGGIGIGLVPDEKFRSAIREETIKLQSGDILILYTDGYPEAMNEENEEFGEENLQNFLEEQISRPPEEIISLLEKRISSWEKKQTAMDDRTIIIIKRR